MSEVAEVAGSEWRRALHLFELGAPAQPSTALCNAAMHLVARACERCRLVDWPSNRMHGMHGMFRVHDGEQKQKPA